MNKNIKTALLFPGQGVPVREVIEYYKLLKNKDPKKTDQYLYALQTSLDEIDPDKKIEVQSALTDENSKTWELTSFVQPLTYILSVLTYELIKLNAEASYVLGHSLGAFSALTAAGTLPLEDGSKLVAARGKFMQEDSDRQNNGMCAIIGLDEEKVKEIALKTGTVIALMNAPSAFVLGGDRKTFTKVNDEAMNLGARKTIVLNTAGAFHTEMMRGAYDKLKSYTNKESFKKPVVPVVINMRGEASTEPDELLNDLIESMIHPVNWTRMMEFLKSNGVSSYIESGPGSSLSVLAKLNGVEPEKIKHAKNLLASN